VKHAVALMGALVAIFGANQLYGNEGLGLLLLLVGLCAVGVAYAGAIRGLARVFEPTTVVSCPKCSYRYYDVQRELETLRSTGACPRCGEVGVVPAPNPKQPIAWNVQSLILLLAAWPLGVVVALVQYSMMGLKLRSWTPEETIVAVMIMVFAAGAANAIRGIINRERRLWLSLLMVVAHLFIGIPFCALYLFLALAKGM